MIKIMMVFILLFYYAPCYAFDFNTDQAFSIGVNRMTNGHSEGAKNRCMNDGWAIDGEYVIPLSLDFNKYIGISLVPGAMLTYSNFETAYRETSKSKESDRKRESGVTLAGTLRPTIRLWKIRAYKLFGLGVDYNQPDSAWDFGYIKSGEGIGIDITDNVSLDGSRRKFKRNDGTFYKYNTLTLTISW